MKKFLVIVCALAVVLSSLPLYAMTEKTERHEWSTGSGRKDWIVRGAESDHYFVKAPSQLFRGLHNVAFGWAEIISHPVRSSMNAPLVVGTLSGLVTGPVFAVTRTFSGAVDVLTFWVPKFKGWPLPKPVLGLSR